jgi:tetratricopeptide (TPR) repeat protein
VATFVLILGEDLETACAGCTALIDLARPRGWLIALAHGSFLRATALVRAGRIREAEADARLSFEFKLRHSPPAGAALGAVSAHRLAHRARRAGRRRRALVAAGIDEPPPGAMTSPLLLQARARLRLAQHRPADALADLVDAAARWDELDVLNPALASWRVDAAEALSALGDRASARRHADEHLALAERLGLPGPLGAGLRALARSAGRDERVALLERAVTLLADSPVQLEHVRALVDLGAALRRANRRADARAPLRRALDLAERAACGCSPLARTTSCRPPEPARDAPRSPGRTR